MAYKTVNGKLVKVVKNNVMGLMTAKQPVVKKIAPWAKQPSFTIKYGKLVMEKEVSGDEAEYFGITAIKIYRANQLSLDSYKEATGGLPYEVETAEVVGLYYDNLAMKQMFENERENELELSSWRDHLLVITKANGLDYAYGFRVAYDNKTKNFDRPAYNDTVLLTAIEAGLCRMAIAGSHLSSYCFHRGEGERKVVQVSAMSYVCLDEAADWHRTATIAASLLGMRNVHRFLD